jgi:hypothetical protein
MTMNEFWTEAQGGAGAAACRVRTEDPKGSNVPELREAVVSFRFVPESYLAACAAALDHGVERLLYLQSLIDEEGEE